MASFSTASAPSRERGCAISLQILPVSPEKAGFGAQIRALRLRGTPRAHWSIELTSGPEQAEAQHPLDPNADEDDIGGGGGSGGGAKEPRLGPLSLPLRRVPEKA